MSIYERTYERAFIHLHFLKKRFESEQGVVMSEVQFANLSQFLTSIGRIGLISLLRFLFDIFEVPLS
jgi:hypothetical protein